MGKKEKELFPYCLKALIEVNGLKEIDDWIEIPYEEEGQEELFELQ